MSTQPTPMPVPTTSPKKKKIHLEGGRIGLAILRVILTPLALIVGVKQTGD
jgi:hypothetical protein